MKQVVRVQRGAAPHWVGDGFPVRTYFSYGDGPAISPFLLLDYASPTRFEPAAAPRGVGPHPHRGFETVTIVYQGELEHRDSAGHGGRIGPGDVQWMTAAGGVVHEELHSQAFTRSGGMLEMVQLWVNLPARDKLAPPRYQDLLAARIPSVPIAGDAGNVRVIAGVHGGIRGPAHTFTPIQVLDVQLGGGRTTKLPMPAGHTGIVLVQRGTIRLAANDLETAELAFLDRAGDAVEIAAATEARLLVLSGEPIHEPVVGHGPFVMNTRAEIAQAIDDFEQGRMGRLG